MSRIQTNIDCIACQHMLALQHPFMLERVCACVSVCVCENYHSGNDRNNKSTKKGTANITHILPFFLSMDLLWEYYVPKLILHKSTVHIHTHLLNTDYYCLCVCDFGIGCECMTLFSDIYDGKVIRIETFKLLLFDV